MMVEPQGNASHPIQINTTASPQHAQPCTPLKPSFRLKLARRFTLSCRGDPQAWSNPWSQSGECPTFTTSCVKKHHSLQSHETRPHSCSSSSSNPSLPMHTIFCFLRLASLACLFPQIGFPSPAQKTTSTIVLVPLVLWALLLGMGVWGILLGELAVES